MLKDRNGCPASDSLFGGITLNHQYPPELISCLLELCPAGQDFGQGLLARDIDSFLRHILEAVVKATQAACASLMLLDEAERILVIKVAMGFPAEIVANTRVKPGEGIAGWVLQKRQPLLLHNGPDIPSNFREMMAREGLSTVICVALEAEGQVLGVLFLARLIGDPPFTSQDLWAASLIAKRGSTWLYTARLSSQLESRERFINRILESIPSSLVVIDRTLRIVSANRNFMEKGRRMSRATLGRKIEEVFPQVLVEYTRLDHKAQEVFRTGQPIEGGKVAYRAPGLPTRIYYYRLIPLKAGEVVENVMVLMDDITEREQLGAEVRRAESHLASVVDCANDLVISLDSQGYIVTWNRASEQASGLKAEQAIGRSLLSLCVDGQNAVMKEMLDNLSHGKRIRKIEVNLRTSSGDEVPIAWSCSPMLDDSRKVTGIVAVGRDLTEQRRLEAQLLQSAKIASLGVMAGGIAHELRNPLGIISASTQLLFEHSNDTHFLNQCMQKIQAATQRASLIIENLLKFSRPGGGHMQQVDLVDVLEETLTLLGHQMALQNVTLKKKFTSELPKVYGNPSLLQQVFINLILNACNAMPQGGTLTVITRAVATKEVKVQFCDSGCGIPAEHLSEIFDPFFTTMPVGKGIGLGLSITYSIIEQHHGNIEVKSQVGQGTTFTVHLPVSQAINNQGIPQTDGVISHSPSVIA